MLVYKIYLEMEPTA